MREPLPFGKVELASPQLLCCLPKSRFGAFLIVNIDTGAKPSDDFSVIVKERDVAMQHPAIFTICPPHPKFGHEGFAGFQCGAALGQNFFDIVGMNGLRPPPPVNFLQRKP